jgi:hypothetical protein
MAPTSYGIAIMVSVGMFSKELRATDVNLGTKAEAEAYAATLQEAEVFEQYCFLTTHTYDKERGLARIVKGGK